MKDGFNRVVLLNKPPGQPTKACSGDQYCSPMNKVHPKMEGAVLVWCVMGHVCEILSPEKGPVWDCYGAVFNVELDTHVNYVTVIRKVTEEA